MRHIIYKLLRKSEKYSKTDMVYLAKGGFWLTVGNVVASFSAFLTAIAFANLLPKATFGTYQYILTIAGLLTFFSLPKVNESLMRSVARGFEGEFFPALKTRVQWGILGGISSLGVAAYYFVNGNSVLSISFLLAAIFIPITEPLGIWGDYLKGKKLFRTTSNYKIASRLFMLAVIVATIFVTDNIFLVLLAYFVSRTLFRLVSLFIVLRTHPPNKEHDQESVSFGKHLSAIAIFKAVIGELDKILIFHYIGAVELALYYFAIAPVMQVRSLLSVLETLAFPKFSKTSEEDLQKSLPRKVMRLELFLIIPAVIGYILFIPYVFPLFFPKYTGAIIFTQVYALTLLFFPRTLFSAALVAKMKKQALYIANFFTPVVRLGLLYAGVRLFGVMGIVVGTVLSNGVVFGTYFFFFKRMKGAEPTPPDVSS